MPQKTEVCSQLTDAQILGAIKEELKHMPIPFPNRIQRVTIDSEAYVILEYPKNEGPDAPGTRYTQHLLKKIMGVPISMLTSDDAPKIAETIVALEPGQLGYIYNPEAGERASAVLTAINSKTGQIEVSISNDLFPLDAASMVLSKCVDSEVVEHTITELRSHIRKSTTAQNSTINTTTRWHPWPDKTLDSSLQHLYWGRWGY